MEMTSPRARGPFITTPGYFIVRREPMLQSIHLTSASSIARAAFGDEIEHVVAPVLDGDVLDFRALERDQFDHRAVQRRRLELRRGAAFHVHDLRALVGDDERALELAEVFRVDAEIGLKRVLHLHTRRDIDKAAAAEHGRVERAEFVVARRDDLAEPLAENLRVLLQPLGAAHEDDALVADGLLDVGIRGLAVELRLDAREEFAFLLWDAQTLETSSSCRRARRPNSGSASGPGSGSSGCC